MHSLEYETWELYMGCRLDAATHAAGRMALVDCQKQLLVTPNSQYLTSNF